MWLKNADLAGTTMTWQEALVWADDLVYAGYDDWRLPSGENDDGTVCNARNTGTNCTETEFWSLWSGYLISALSPGIFENIRYGTYWTSTEWPDNTSNAMGYYQADPAQNDWPKTNNFYVWAVRDVVASSPDISVPASLSFNNCSSEADVIGNWTINVDWDCDGEDGSTIIIFNSDYTWMENNGYTDGTWTFSNGVLEFTINGIAIVYTGIVDGTHVQGTMVSSTGSAGCFTGDKVISGTVAEQVQKKDDNGINSSGILVGGNSATDETLSAPGDVRAEVQMLSGNLVIRNVGDALLEISNVADNRNWLILGNISPYPIQIAAGDLHFVSLDIDWDLVAGASDMATVSVTSNDPDEPVVYTQVNVTNCTPMYPDISVPASLSFNNCSSVDDVIGAWTIYYDWECDGAPGTSTFTFNNDNTWLNSSGSTGTWTFANGVLEFVFDAFNTVYTGVVDGTYIEGTMIAYDYGNRTGCFTGDKVISGTVTEQVQEKYDNGVDASGAASGGDDATSETLSAPGDVRAEIQMLSGNLVIRNIGDALLEVSNVTDDKDWLILGGISTYPIQVDPGDLYFVSLDIDWDLVTAASDMATVSVTSNDPDEPVVYTQVNVTNCTPMYPDISVPASLSFNNCSSVDDVIGAWTIYYDWECDGAPGTSTFTFNNDNTWLNSAGSTGTWTFANGVLEFVFDAYNTVYTGVVDGTYIEGTMIAYDYGNRTGCFTGDKVISGTVTEQVQEKYDNGVDASGAASGGDDAAEETLPAPGDVSAEVQMLSGNLVIRNIGDALLEVSNVTDDKDWLILGNISPYPIQIAAGDLHFVSLDIDWDLVAGASDMATVSVTSNDPDEPVVYTQVHVTKCMACTPGWEVVTYTNSTTAYGTVTIGDESTPASEEDFVGAFVGEECRAVGHPVISDGQAYVTLVIQGEEVEEVEFRVFDTSECAVLENGRATTNPGGAIGYPPDYLQICAGCYVHQDVELNAGWNLMSLYVHPDDMSPESIFGPVTCLLQVKNMTQSYDPALPSFLNTLTALEDGNGYFVNMGCAETLSLDAALVDGAFVVINLNSGWNLIGYPFRTGQAVEDAFAMLIGSGKLVQVKSMTQSYDPLLPPFLKHTGHGRARTGVSDQPERERQLYLSGSVVIGNG